MIVDHIKNIRRYPQFEEYAEAIMEFIEKCRREFLPAGRYDLLADNRLYALWDSIRPSSFGFVS